MNEVITLGIESSCDESGVAIYSNKRGLIADELFSQIELHQEYGGVVPEIASRDHLRKIHGLAKRAIDNANLSPIDINHVAYTKGPGLAGALLVGASFAKSFALANNIKTTGVNHLEGHILAPILSGAKLTYPFITLLVSGGHTLLVKANKLGDYQILGQSIDDAVGEAFDKTAKILGLGYPGGAELAKLATKGNEDKFSFPEPIKHKGLNFSFSGLKTFALNTFNANPDNKADIAKAFEISAVNVLVAKTKKALLETGCNNLIIAGGVSSNLFLREQLTKLDANVIMAEQKFCTDNGAMIALCGNLRFCQLNDYDKTNAIDIKPKWPIDLLGSAV